MKFTDFCLLLEDEQSVLNQTKNLLMTNGYADQALDVTAQLKGVYDSQNVIERSKARNKRDTDIFALGYLYIALSYTSLGGPNNYYEVEDLDTLYAKYLNTFSLSDKNHLGNMVTAIKNEVTVKKMFKYSDKKLDVIVNTCRPFVATIDKDYVAPEKNKKFVRTATVDNNLVYEDDTLRVYVGDTKERCIQLGKGTDLCISDTEGTNYFWRYRMGKMYSVDYSGMTTYFVFWKEGGKRVLVDALGKEDKQEDGAFSYNTIDPNNDKLATTDELLGLYPDLTPAMESDVFKFIPWGPNEELFSSIDDAVYNEDIDSILDSVLDTLEKREIYIECDGKVSAYDWDDLPSSQVPRLMKKYMGLGNVIPSEVTDKYMSKRDMDWFNNKVLPRQPITTIVPYISTLAYRKADIPDGVMTAFDDYYSSATPRDTDYAVTQDVADICQQWYITNKFIPKSIKNICARSASTLLTYVKWCKRDNQEIPTFIHRILSRNPMLAYDYVKMFGHENIPPYLVKAIAKNAHASKNYAEILLFNKEPIPDIIEKTILRYASAFMVYQLIKSMWHGGIEVKDSWYAYIVAKDPHYAVDLFKWKLRLGETIPTVFYTIDDGEHAAIMTTILMKYDKDVPASLYNTVKEHAAPYEVASILELAFKENKRQYIKSWMLRRIADHDTFYVDFIRKLATLGIQIPRSMINMLFKLQETNKHLDLTYVFRDLMLSKYSYNLPESALYEVLVRTGTPEQVSILSNWMLKHEFPKDLWDYLPTSSIIPIIEKMAGVIPQDMIDKSIDHIVDESSSYAAHAMEAAPSVFFPNERLVSKVLTGDIITPVMTLIHLYENNPEYITEKIWVSVWKSIVKFLNTGQSLGYITAQYFTVAYNKGLTLPESIKKDYEEKVDPYVHMMYASEVAGLLPKINWRLTESQHAFINNMISFKNKYKK